MSTKPTFPLLYRRIAVFLIAAIIAGLSWGYHGQVKALIGGGRIGGGPARNAGHQIRQPAMTAGANLVAYYNLDGNANDSTTNARNGTVTGATVATGRFGQGYNFNGTTDNISIGDIAAFNGSSSFTISAWVQPHASGTSTGYLGKRSNMNSTPAGWGIGAINSGSRIGFRLGDGTNNISLNDNGTAFTTEVWHHVLVTWNSSTKTGTEYINTVQVDSAANASITLASVDNSDSFLLGGVTQNKGNISLDDVRFYNAVLTTTDIATLYAGSKPPACDQTCGGWWKLDETSGTSMADSSGNGRTGTLTLNSGEFWADSIYKGAVHFDNITLKNTLVIIGDVLDMNASQSFTVEAWINHDDAGSGTERFIAKRSAGNLGLPGWYCAVTSSDRFNCYIEDGTSFSAPSSTSNAVITPGTWYHVVGVYDRSNQNIRLYVNGRLDTTSSSIAAIGDSSNASNLEIGCTSGNTANSSSDSTCFDGKIDDVRVYTRVLQPYEIEEHYLAGLRF